MIEFPPDSIRHFLLNVVPQTNENYPLRRYVGGRKKRALKNQISNFDGVDREWKEIFESFPGMEELVH